MRSDAIVYRATTIKKHDKSISVPNRHDGGTACNHTRAHLDLLNDLLKQIRRWTPNRIRHDDDDEKARVHRCRLHHHHRNAHVMLAVLTSELADDMVPVHEQPSRDEPSSSKVEH
jgi:hypothetical protein